MPTFFESPAREHDAAFLRKLKQMRERHRLNMELLETEGYSRPGSRSAWQAGEGAAAAAAGEGARGAVEHSAAQEAEEAAADAAGAMGTVEGPSSGLQPDAQGSPVDSETKAAQKERAADPVHRYPGHMPTLVFGRLLLFCAAACCAFRRLSLC